MKILIIEDDLKICSFMEKGFKEAGFTVDTAQNGLDGLHLALEGKYDVAILDLMLPELDGLSVLEKMRAAQIKTPVIILSAKKSVDDRIKGLQKGGDDYMTKPFAFSELLARVNALMRRASHGSEPTKLQYKALSLDLVSHEVTRVDQKISLNAKEFALLVYLMKNPGRIISKTAILENIYGYNFDPQTNVVDVLVFRLRNKIDKDFDNKMIHTVRGMGYILEEKTS